MNAATVKALRGITKKPLEKDARRRGVAVGDLITRGLVVRRKRTEKRYLVPEGAPRWATRFRSSRKKYGVEEHTKEDIFLELTDRGLRMLKRSQLSKPFKDPVVDDPNIIEVEEQNENSSE